jgi:hypothetical protein
MFCGLPGSWRELLSRAGHAEGISKENCYLPEREVEQNRHRENGRDLGNRVDKGQTTGESEVCWNGTSLISW